MRKRFGVFIYAILVLIISGSAFAQNLSIRAVSPQAVAGEIDGSQDFQIDLTFNLTGIYNLSGGTFGVYFYSPDMTLFNVVHRDVDGYGPRNSITFSTVWQNTFAILNWVNMDQEYGFNGQLPDSAYHTFLSFGGLAPGTGEQTHITYHMKAEAAIGGLGTLCIDSAGQGPTEDSDWLFESDLQVVFNGPYCWEIRNLSSLGEPPVISCAEDIELPCGQPTDPENTGFASHSAW